MKFDIEIDGQNLTVEQGQMLIEVADQAGFHIPRFCYHKKLSVAANCRMCLVEVDKAPKPLPACATPVSEGMKVYTQSKKAREAQQSVMEFLLINHPLDCPICDQGGECELQDVSLGYGKDISRFTERKRTVDDDDLGSLISTDMTRCIHCTRCVRFGQEIAGVRELGATGRGEHTQISTYIKHSLESELSGNIIDLCPVGALTSKPYRYTARSWELNQHASVAPHDCIGSNIYAHTRRQKVMRVVPRENDSINESWLSDRDRFSYEGLSKDRLAQPLIKRNNKWQPVDWSTALNEVVKGLEGIKQAYGQEELAALVSPNATIEEHYLAQKLWRGLGSNNIDHRLRQVDSRDQNFATLYPQFNMVLESINQQKAILLIGSNLQREQPIAGHRVRQASLNGAEVFCVNPIDFDFNFDVKEKLICKPGVMANHLAGIAKALSIISNNTPVNTDVLNLIETIQPSELEQAIAEKLYQANSETLIEQRNNQVTILLGELAQNHPEASTLRVLAQLIANLANFAAIGELTQGSNTAGAWIAGCVPHRAAVAEKVEKPGKTVAQIIEQGAKGLLLLGVEPELDCANAASALATLRDAQFVVAITPFSHSSLLEHADVILPCAPFSETSGTFVNVEGTWQSFAAVVSPFEQARPAWKILRVLGNLFELEKFDYMSSTEIRDELFQLLEASDVPEEYESYVPSTLTGTINSGITRITEWPIYNQDMLVRRAPALQTCATHEEVMLRINSKLAAELQFAENDKASVSQTGESIELPVKIDERIPDGCALVHAGFAKTIGLADSFGSIEIRK